MFVSYPLIRQPKSRPVDGDRVSISYVNENDPALKRGMMHLVEMACGRRHLENLYHAWKNDPTRDANRFWNSAMEKMEIAIDTNQAAWPPSGYDKDRPAVIIANHPYGLLDGVAICALAEQLGRPFKVLVNAALMKVPELEEWFLPVDFEETRDAMRNNMQTRKKALAHLAEGGVVVIFPAGGVSTADNPFGKAEDLPWKPFTARLVQQAGADILPVYFSGQNGFLFHLVSKFSDGLRVALLIGALRRHLGKPLDVRVGNPLSSQSLNSLPDRNAMMDWLRGEVFALA